MKKVDDLKKDKIINEDVVIQKGYTNYAPQYCESYKLVNYNDMQKYLKTARIIITHGGPASFIAPLAVGKIPIVVPRQKKFNEHVNNHQKDFVEQIVARDNTIIPCYDIDDLERLIKEYDSIVKNMKDNYKSNNKLFCKKLDEEIKNIFNMRKK